MNQLILRTGMVLLLFGFLQRLSAQCNPDVTPPVAACLNGLEVNLPVFGNEISISAEDLDAGSTDNCCAVSFLAARNVDGPCDGDNLPDALTPTLTFCCQDANTTVTVTLQVSDCNSNTSTCTLPVYVKDYTPPVAACDEFTVVSIGIDNTNDCYLPNGNNFAGVTWVQATTFDDGSYDNCSPNIHFTVRRMAPFSECITSLNAVNGHPDCADAFPDFPSEFERAVSEQDSIKFYACEVGTTQNVILRVYQLEANGSISLNQSGTPIYNECIIQVEVQDKMKPVCTAPPNVTVSCEEFDPSLWAYGNATVVDNACLDTIITTINYAQFDTLCPGGTIVRSFRAIDCSGNSSTCSQSITVNYVQNYFVHFPNDLIVTDCDNLTNFGEPTFYQEDCELIGVSYEDEIFTGIPGIIYRLERTWTIINWCTYDPLQPVITIPNPQPNAVEDHPANLPGPTVSAPGTPNPWNSTIVKINPTDPSPTDYSTFFDANVNGYRYKQIIKVIEPNGTSVSGTVFSDTLQNCALDAGEPGLSDFQVQMVGTITGRTYVVTPQSDGAFSQLICPGDSAVTLTLLVPFNYGQNCASTYTVDLIPNQNTVQDVPVALEAECPLLGVDMTTPILRRCFSNYYTVNACNYSNDPVSGVYVEVQLDAAFSVQTTSIPGTDQGNNLWSFPIGTLEAGECTDFNIQFILSCEAPLGATHCSSAHIYPDTLCPTSSNWSGANIQVSAMCDGDSVRMEITNTGTGNMAQMLDFIVVEDVIMVESDQFQLNAGQSREITVPANGATWRLQADQEPYHPFGGPEVIALEGCGGINQTGLVTQLPINNPNPFTATDCQQNVGSFDPNDKQAIPSGYGDDHMLEANTDLEYLIRFQNTGTDTAFNIVVLDTLSEYLDLAHVRPGAASHLYDFTILDGRVLKFVFSNILLPDSNINEPLSHGFVKFMAPQMPDNPNGTRIENTAYIYFDFNSPVATNTTFHTVGDHFITSGLNDPSETPLIAAVPNPAGEYTIITLPSTIANGTCILYNGIGKPVRSQIFNGNSLRFNCAQLPSGTYYFRIVTENRVYGSGKILLK